MGSSPASRSIPAGLHDHGSHPPRIAIFSRGHHLKRTRETCRGTDHQVDNDTSPETKRPITAWFTIGMMTSTLNAASTTQISTFAASDPQRFPAERYPAEPTNRITGKASSAVSPARDARTGAATAQNNVTAPRNHEDVGYSARSKGPRKTALLRMEPRHQPDSLRQANGARWFPRCRDVYPLRYVMKR